VAPAPPDSAALVPVPSTARSTSLVTGLTATPSRWVSRGRGLVSCHFWTHALLPHLLVAHAKEALAGVLEQYGRAAMEIKVVMVEVAALTPSAQSKVTISLPVDTDDASS
jgi:uncharacterized membrane protein YhiD involved in acid resistance